MHQSREKYRPGARLRMSCLAAATLFANQPLLADGVPAVYEMSVIEDAAEGRRLTQGDFVAAIDELSEPRLFGSPTFAMNNNLCVAYTKTMKFEQAADACDEAVDARRRVSHPARWYNSPVTRTRVRDKAMALSNRGVLRAVTGDVAGARADFEQAIAMEAPLESPRANLMRLDAKSLQAASTDRD